MFISSHFDCTPVCLRYATAIGVELTEEFQLDPERSTSAIIIHRPEDGYFNIE